MMKTLSIFVMIFFIAGSGLIIAADTKDNIDSEPFGRTVAMLENADARTMVKDVSSGLRISCTILPQKRFIAFAWEIENPNKTVLNITPDSITVSDRVEKLKDLEPGQVADILFGSVLDKEFVDPFVNSQYAERYKQPSMRPRTQREKYIYASAFNFEKTDSGWVSGITYYSRSAASNNLTAAITLNGETIKFDF